MFKKNTLLFLFFTLLFSNAVRSNYYDSGQDPADNINYKIAYYQTKIHHQYKSLMAYWGCDKNIFNKDCLTKKQLNETDEKDIQGNEAFKNEAFENEAFEMEKRFQSACLKKLYAARRWAVTKPAIESLTYISLMTAATLVIAKMLPKESMGGSFSIFNSVFNSVFFLKDIIKSGYLLAFPQQSSLTSLEEQFAINKCFIPRDLWPAITEKFMIARRNKYEQRKAMDFLEFSLGLTVYKSKSTLYLQEKSTEKIIQTLHEKIDLFFYDYEKEGVEKSLQQIKVNVSKFILNLFDQKNCTARYIYFHGPAGIGKTFFVHKLCQWIEELAPGSVRFDNMIITSANELEGSPQRPGALLRVLRNQSIANKRGSVVFMDEATWLNEMQSAAKRTFNGDQASLSTDYFGDGIEGAGISIAIPPMLFFLASNDEIKDPALKSRFDIVQFPSPTKKSLVEHAITKAEESSILSCDDLPDRAVFNKWIEEEKINNFRHVEADVEQFVLSYAQVNK